MEDFRFFHSAPDWGQTGEKSNDVKKTLNLSGILLLEDNMRFSNLFMALTVIMSVFLCGCAPGKGRYKVKIQPPSGSKDNSEGYITWKDYKKHYKICDVTNYQELLDYAVSRSRSKTNANNLFLYVKDTKTIFEVVSNYYLKQKNITSEEDYYNGLAPKIVFVGPKTKKEHLLIALPGVDTDIPFITEEIVREEGIGYSNLDNKTLCCYDPGKIFSTPSLRKVKDYSELSYKNKINAFLSLCQHLGAKSVKLSYFTDDKTSIGGDVKVNAQGQGGGIGGKYEEQLQRLFACNAKFEGKPIKGPLPESIWDNEFSDFVARRQHENRLLREEMGFEYSESMGISGHIQGQIRSVVGIDIGLSMNKDKRYKCVYIVEF